MTNLYRSIIPASMKTKNWKDGDQALQAYMIEVLYVFIEKECENGIVKYHEKPDELPKTYLDDETIETRTYRGLKKGHVLMSPDMMSLIDLYWFFKCEYDDLVQDIQNDFSTWIATPDGEEPFYEEVLENGFVLHHPNQNRKYPDYQRKYIYEGTPDDYIMTLTQEALLKLVTNMHIMWC